MSDRKLKRHKCDLWKKIPKKRNLLVKTRTCPGHEVSDPRADAHRHASKQTFKQRRSSAQKKIIFTNVLTLSPFMDGCARTPAQTNADTPKRTYASTHTETHETQTPTRKTNYRKSRRRRKKQLKPELMEDVRT